jgi:predicted pyridoxine 5'-phosphate oxidase superfamily flavin-nucleotide-binding protein
MTNHQPSNPFHAGEIAVQLRAGVRAEAQRLCSLICPEVQPAAEEFLSKQSLAIASSIDASNRSWASLLIGQPGFVRVVDQQMVEIQATSVSGDPLQQNLQSNSQIGILVIDLANRKRLRLNGEAIVQPTGAIVIHLQHVFFNCPKYIQTRYLETTATAISQSPQIQIRSGLTQPDRNWIAQADTFFIASAHPDHGADASHRGGYPGFVQVVDAETLLFPDYAGNNLFQTLGNLTVNPNAGLLFIDFEQGHTLQLTGQATILWDAEQMTAFAGAQRLIQFSIRQVRETRNATSQRWRFGDYSPANPAV